MSETINIQKAQLEYLLECRRQLKRDNQVMVAIVIVACILALVMALAFASVVTGRSI